MLRRTAAACVAYSGSTAGSSSVGTSTAETAMGAGRTTKFGNASGMGRKVNPAGRPAQEFEKQSLKAIMRPFSIVRLCNDYDSAQLLKPRLDLSRRPPPTEAEAVALYRALLKKAERQLVWTDKQFFRRMLRFEFTVTSRIAEDRLDVQRCMFEKGEWLLMNDLGGMR